MPKEAVSANDVSHTQEHRHHKSHANRSHRFRVAGRFLEMLSLFGILMPLLLWPILWGGRHSMATGLIGLIVSVAVGCWALGNLLKGYNTLKPAWGFFFFIPVLFISALQLCPWVFNLFAPEAIKTLWENSAAIGIPHERPILAVMPDFQIAVLSAYVAVAFFYLLISQTVDTIKTTMVVVVLMVLVTTINSLLGLIQLTEHWEWFLWLYKGSEKVVSAGYFNRDHFADVALIGVFVTLGLLLAITSAKHGSELRITNATLRTTLIGAMTLAEILNVVALGLTYSRAAILIALAGLAICTLWIAIVRRGKLFSLPILVLLIGIGVLSFWGLDLLLARLEMATSGVDESGLTRFEIWKSVIDAIALNPWFGSGFGATKALSPLFETGVMTGKLAFDAHNDYLDLFAQFGAPVAIFVILGMAFLVVRTLVSIMRYGKHSSVYPLAIASFLAILCILAHAIVEYSLKQPANLMLFVVLCVVVDFMTQYLKEKSLNSDQEASKSEVKKQSRPYFGFAKSALFAMILIGAVTLTPFYANRLHYGFELAKLEEMAAIKQTAIHYEIRNQMRLNQANRVLSLNPHSEMALGLKIETLLDSALELEKESLAAELEKLTGQPVNPHQVFHRSFETYINEARYRVDKNDRVRLANQYKIIAELCTELAAISPSNAIAISLRGYAKDIASYWEGNNTTALADYAYSAKLYPYHSDVLSRSIRGYSRAIALDKENNQKLVNEMLQYTKVLCEERSYELHTMLPFINFVTNDVNDIALIVPDTVMGYEIYGRWLTRNGHFNDASKAFEKAETINDKRLDDEKPWTMGNLQFLKRERRDKDTVRLALSRDRLALYKKNGDLIAFEEEEKRQLQYKYVVNTKEIIRIDAFIKDGEYALAEVIIKKLGDDPRALIRYAEIARTQGRDAKFREVMDKLSATVETMDEETRKRYSDIQTVVNK